MFKQSNSLTIFVCLLLLRIHPLDGLGVPREPQGCGEPQKVCIALSFMEI
jgi:hypothetical protein